DACAAPNALMRERLERSANSRPQRVFSPTAQSCYFEEDSLQAATPGHPERLRVLYPSGRSPSRTAGNRRLGHSQPGLMTSHACTDGTLPLLARRRNNKLAGRCEETVEDLTCLWKEKEKSGKNVGPSTYRRL